jgi:vacuolar protein sorting-associated protein 26A/B
MITAVLPRLQGAGPSTFNESETITKFEIMDGAPVRGAALSARSSLYLTCPVPTRPYTHHLLRLVGESIPLRIFLGGFDLTPTYRNINNKVFTD